MLPQSSHLSWNKSLQHGWELKTSSRLLAVQRITEWESFACSTMGIHSSVSSWLTCKRNRTKKTTMVSQLCVINTAVVQETSSLGWLSSVNSHFYQCCIFSSEDTSLLGCVLSALCLSDSCRALVCVGLCHSTQCIIGNWDEITTYFFTLVQITELKFILDKVCIHNSFCPSEKNHSICITRTDDMYLVCVCSYMINFWSTVVFFIFCCCSKNE